SDHQRPHRGHLEVALDADILLHPGAPAAGELPRRETAAPPSLSPPLFSNPAKGIYARPQIFLGGFLQILGTHLQYLDLFSIFYGEFVNSIKNHRKILK